MGRGADEPGDVMSPGGENGYYVTSKQNVVGTN